eukprot:6208165-Pleurochrysis_carterae.AAC.3
MPRPFLHEREKERRAARSTTLRHYRAEQRTERHARESTASSTDTGSMYVSSHSALQETRSSQETAAPRRPLC